MKRVLCLLLSIVLAVGLTTFVSASVPDGSSVSIEIADIQAKVEDTITVIGTIDYLDTVQFATIAFSFSYPTDCLTYVANSATMTAPAGAMTTLINENNGVITGTSMAFANNITFTKGGELFRAQFIVKEAAVDKTLKFTVDTSKTYYAGLDMVQKKDIAVSDFSIVVTDVTKHTVTFDNNGHGTAPESKTVAEGSLITLPSMENDGYFVFTGWKAGETDYTAGTPYTVNAPVTFVAQWNDTTPSHTVAYDTNGHGNPPSSVSVREGDKINLPTLADEGYIKFAGWKEENGTQTYTGEYTVMKDVILIAQWNDTTPSHTVTFDNNGHGTAPTAQTVKEGTRINLPSMDNDGYFVFGGWQLEGTVYTPRTSYLVNAPVTFEAQWNDTTPSHSVTFDVNGHGDPQESQTVREGTSITLPRLARDGSFRFVGWKCQDDDEIHAGGSTFTVMKAVSFTAQWKEAANTDAAVTPKSLYNKYNKSYTVDVYFSGASADSVAFGFAYSADLTFVSFVAADGYANLEPLTTNENGVFATVITVDGSDAAYINAEENEVLLGTIKFTFTGSEFVEGMAGERIRTAQMDEEEGVFEGGYFVFAEHADGLDVFYDPLNVEDNEETIQELPTVDVTGSVKILRASTDAPKNFAEIRFYTEDGELALKQVIENADTRTDANGEFTYTANITIGRYYVVVSKSGYKSAKSEVFDVPVDADTIIETIELLAGDTADSTAATAGDGVIDLIDFARIKRAFTPDITDDQLIVCDINEDGAVNVEDLNIIKTNFGK